MNDLHQAADRHTPTSAATQAAAAVEEDNSPRLETMIRMDLETTAVAHHNAVHRAGDVLVCRADRACVDLLCTYSTGALGVAGHSRV